MGWGGRQTSGSFLLGSRGARRKRCWRCSKSKEDHQCGIDGGGRGSQSSDGIAAFGYPRDSTRSGPRCHSCRRAIRRFSKRSTSSTGFSRPGGRRRNPAGGFGTVSRSPSYNQGFCIEGYSQEDSNSFAPRRRGKEHPRDKARDHREPGYRSSPCSAEHGNNSSGGPSDRSGPHDGVGFEQFFHNVIWDQGGPEEGPHDERFSLGEVSLLPTVPTTTSPKDVSDEACAGHPRAVRCLRCIPPVLLGALWGLSPTKGAGLCDVAPRSHRGCSSQRRPATDPGARGVDYMRRRAGCKGWWRLEPGIHAGLDFRSASCYVPREDANYDIQRPCFWSSHSGTMGSHGTKLHEGDRDSDDPEDRSQKDKGRPKRWRRQRHLPQWWPGFAEEETAFPQEAQGECRVKVAPGLEAPRQKKPEDGPGFSEDRHLPESCTDNSGKQSMHEKGRDDPLAVDFCLDFPRWCSSLFISCLRSRTAFAAFLSRSTLPSREKPSPSSSVFPLPVPSWSPFERMPPNASSRRRRSIHFARAFHTVIMALNFWHGGGDFGMLRDLSRPISPVHSAIFRRVKSLMRADGQFPAFQVIRAGRRFPQLVARLREATDFICQSGVTADPYSKHYPGSSVSFNKSLVPDYRDADPERITLSGSGHWDVTHLLSDDLCMPYREPDVIKSGRLPPPGECPRIKESEEDIAAIAKLWDSKGLLLVHVQHVPKHEWVRIFGAFKDESRDRQIGDRRGRNYVEDKTFGPSSELPNGTALTDLVVDRSTQEVRICVTDRKDFYHQIYATRRKAVCNSLGGGVPYKLLEGSGALAHFLMQGKKKKPSKEQRMIEGDFLHADQYAPMEDGRTDRKEASDRQTLRPGTLHRWLLLCGPASERLYFILQVFEKLLKSPKMLYPGGSFGISRQGCLRSSSCPGYRGRNCRRQSSPSESGCHRGFPSS